MNAPETDAPQGRGGGALIGVELTEEMQLVPEQSTDAIVVHHPEAKYFST